MREITRKEELNELVCKNSVLKVGTDCCGQCNAMEGFIKSIESDYPNVEFAKIDADECDWIIDEMDIKSIPTLVVWKHGCESYEMYRGLKTATELRNIFKFN